MSYTEIRPKRYKCHCEAVKRGNKSECGHDWEAANLPVLCPKCRSRSWNGPDRRVKVVLTHNGKSQSVQKWAKEIGISANTIYQRIWREWPIEDVLTGDKFAAGRKPKEP